MVAAPFAPSRNPILAMFLLLMGAEFDTAPGDTGLVTSIKCSGIHIALLSSHRICPPWQTLPPTGSVEVRWRPVAAYVINDVVRV